MSIGEILSDALVYPINNIKAFIIFMILSIVGAVIGGTSIINIIGALSTTGWSSVAFSGLSIIGVVIFILILFLISGYTLDIIKYGIERRNDSPGIDFGRQVANAIKLIIVDIVYYIVPAIIIFVLGLFLRNWLMTIISIIILILFALANFMAKCKLAKTDSLGEALSIGEAIGDISRVGLGKLIATIILILFIIIIIAIIITLISGINATIGSILLGIASVYILFFYNRAIGLLYSD